MSRRREVKVDRSIEHDQDKQEQLLEDLGALGDELVTVGELCLERSKGPTWKELGLLRRRLLDAYGAIGEQLGVLEQLAGGVTPEAQGGAE